MLSANFCERCGHQFRTQFENAGLDQTQLVPPPAGLPLYGTPPLPQPPPYGGQFHPAARPKDRIAAGILALLLGGIGMHLFYLGHTGWGVFFLLLTILTCGWGGLLTGVIALIQGVLYLCATEHEFQQKYVIEKRFF